MNCMEYRRIKLADPLAKSETMASHIRECSACMAFSQQVDRGEKRLREAVNIEVPPNLAEYIILKRRTRSWRLPMLAAVAALGSIMTAGIYYFSTASWPSLPNAVIAHVLQEPQALEDALAAGTTPIERVFLRSGATMTGNIGEITHSSRCKIAHGSGDHLVVHTPFGKVTLILLPEERVATRMIGHDAGLNAVVAPAGKGVYAIVTDSMQKTLEVENLISQNVAWTR